MLHGAELLVLEDFETVLASMISNGKQTALPPHHNPLELFAIADKKYFLPCYFLTFLFLSVPSPCIHIQF